MSVKISGEKYAMMYGPTVGDKVRLADTSLVVEVEKDFTTYGDEIKFGGGKTIRDYGIKEEDFLATLDEMVENAFDDQCTGANPRYPLMSEIKEMYLRAYYGKEKAN